MATRQERGQRGVLRLARRVVACAVVALACAGAAGEPASESRPLGGARGSREAEPLGVSGGAGASMGAGLGRTALALGFVVGLALLGGAVVRKAARAQGGLIGAMGAGGQAPSGILEVLGRYPIGRGQKLVLLRVDRRVLLLSHVAPSRLSRGGGLTTLCEITGAEEVASILTQVRDAEGESLAAKFRAMLAGYGHGEDADEAEETIPGRAVTLGRDGTDRTELWDDRRAPAAGRGEGAVEAVRRRLEAMRRAAGGVA